jgi:multiple sugar transport system substrate-binding protein
VLPVTVERYDNMAEEEVMNDRATPQEAANRAAERINDEIQRTLNESPELREKYDELVALQQKIDEHRCDGKKIPLEWIKNPFYRAYYLKNGSAAEGAKDQ